MEMILQALFIIGAITRYSTSEEVKCSRDFRKVGCFVRNLKLIPDLLITDLDPTHKNHTTDVNWENYSGSLHSLACRCRDKAIGHYKYFGIGMFGECSGGNDNTAIEKLFKNPDKSPYSCVNGEHGDCDVIDVNECTGTVDYDFFYEIIDGSCKDEDTKTIESFSAQTELTKGKLLTTLPKVGKVYEVSFEIYPTKSLATWRSIIHFTIVGNHGVYGDRIPGVWFHPSSSGATTNKFHICNAIDGNVNYCYNSEQFPLNKWIKVKISQRKVANDYEYMITLNDKKVMQKKNSRPVTFDNVKVYVADPWYEAQPGYIRNLKVTVNCTESASRNNYNKLTSSIETSLERNKEIGYLSNLCKEYQVSFDVKPMKYGWGWYSVFHMSVGGNYVVYGDRSPGIWFKPSSSSAKTNSLHICAPISRNRNHCFNTKAFPLDEWISVKVSQKKEIDAYMYRIHINGKEVYKIKNTHALKFYDVKVYAADPWSNAQVGKMRNISIDGGQCN